jgi:hypothetical protein
MLPDRQAAITRSFISRRSIRKYRAPGTADSFSG